MREPQLEGFDKDGGLDRHDFLSPCRRSELLGENVPNASKNSEQWKPSSRFFDTECLVQESLEKMTLPSIGGGRRQKCIRIVL